MFVSEVCEMAREVTDLVAEFRARLATADGDSQIEALKVWEQLRRELAHDTLATIARLDRSGEFDQRGVTAQAAVAEVLGCHPAKARRQVAVARSVFPTTLDGQPVEPRLSSTAAALGRYVIDSAHADVIERLLDSPTARRLPPDTWTGAETQLAEWAARSRPDELRQLGTQLLEALDQDGAERDADALGALCTQALNDADLPDKGGERPQLTVIIQEKDLRRGLRGATLDTGRITASYLRRLACDCAILPVVMSGDSHGPTNLNNLIMLCWTHHRMIHHSGWQVRMRDGWPEFIPPKWLDHTQTPRRKPRYPLTA